MIVHLFNPSHDEALAAHREQYCPTLAARRLGAQLADLPRWWSGEDDVCLRLPESMNLAEVVRPDWQKVERIEPWGWDVHIAALLRRLGAPEHLLPTSQQLESIRMLSSRQTTVRLLQILRTQPLAKGILPVESWWCTTLEVVESVLEFQPDAMLKTPWSSSGRGVFSVRGGVDALPRPRVLKIFREQGGIEVQPLLHRIADAALEFEVSSLGEVRFLGCSLFSTAETGAYIGHFVDAPDCLQTRFLQLWQSAMATCSSSSSATVSAEGAASSPLSSEEVSTAFSHLLRHLTTTLTHLFSGNYVGPLGVDVLFTPEGIHPCVEINLRRTMGHVALAIAHRLSPQQLPATFSVATGSFVLQTADLD